MQLLFEKISISFPFLSSMLSTIFHRSLIYLLCLFNLAIAIASSGESDLDKLSTTNLNNNININDYFDYFTEGSRKNGYVKFVVVLNNSNGSNEDNGDVKQRSIKEIYFQKKILKFHDDLIKNISPFKEHYNDSTYSQMRRQNIIIGVLENNIKTVIDGDGTVREKSNLNFVIDTLDAENKHIPIDLIEGIHKSLTERIQHKDLAIKDLTLKPMTKEQQEAISISNSKIPLWKKEVDSDNELIKSNCYSSGYGLGRLIAVKGSDLQSEFDKGNITLNDIVLLDDVPKEAPQLMGIISKAPSTNYSHVVLYSIQTETPFLHLNDQNELSKLDAIAKKKGQIFFKTICSKNQNESSFVIKDLTPLLQDSSEQKSKVEEISRKLLKYHIGMPIEILRYDESEKSNSLLDLSLASSGLEDVGLVGAKASQTALIINTLTDNSVGIAKGGMGVPIKMYGEFLEKSIDKKSGKKLFEFIAPLMKKIQLPTISQGELISSLNEIQERIKDAIVPSDLKEKILSPLYKKFGKGKAIKLSVRSSSNAEDTPYFNGAGIYSSTTACLGDDELPASANSLCNPNGKRKPVIDRIKDEVWKSMFNPKAFMARQHFQIKEENVGMGVLIHPFISGEKSNGVLVIGKDKSPDDGSDIYSMNSSSFSGGENLVTSPPEGAHPEEIKISAPMDSIDCSSMSRVSYSSLEKDNKEVNSDDEYQKLFELSIKILEEFEKKSPYFKNGENQEMKEKLKLDMEWIILPAKSAFNNSDENKIVFLQSRTLPLKQKTKEILEKEKQLIDALLKLE
ncbi:MAG: hypothetical protein HQK49_00280 [Oligoflexia bacterium]|nr:hypothetical protein [Oligoflexia bacterium]